MREIDINNFLEPMRVAIKLYSVCISDTILVSLALCIPLVIIFNTWIPPPKFTFTPPITCLLLCIIRILYLCYKYDKNIYNTYYKEFNNVVKIMLGLVVMAFVVDLWSHL